MENKDNIPDMNYYKRENFVLLLHDSLQLLNNEYNIN